MSVRFCFYDSQWKTYLYKASNSYTWSEIFPSPLGDGIIRFPGLGKVCSLFPLFCFFLWSSFPFNQSTRSWASHYSASSAASLLLPLPWLLRTACSFHKSNPLPLPYHRLSRSGLWVLWCLHQALWVSSHSVPPSQSLWAWGHESVTVPDPRRSAGMSQLISLLNRWAGFHQRWPSWWWHIRTWLPRLLPSAGSSSESWIPS